MTIDDLIWEGCVALAGAVMEQAVKDYRAGNESAREDLRIKFRNNDFWLACLDFEYKSFDEIADIIDAQESGKLRV